MHECVKARDDEWSSLPWIYNGKCRQVARTFVSFRFVHFNWLNRCWTNWSWKQVRGGKEMHTTPKRTLQINNIMQVSTDGSEMTCGWSFGRQLNYCTTTAYIPHWYLYVCVCGYKESENERDGHVVPFCRLRQNLLQLLGCRCRTQS